MGLPVGDWGAGTLVWVQRKNGSWWPGRVVETNDLSPSPPVHGRVATPIKLLGRDDATVDWYNVEKSKRIKAFRCGEFDDCIERVESRAESSPANFPKKIVKYARREGAILQALELEKQEVQKKHKAAGKERPGIICQAKRSRRVYLPADSNNCWKRTAFSPELLKVSSSTFEVHERPQQSGSAEDDASSRSMESDPTEKDSRCPPGRVQKGTQLSDAAILLSSRTSNSGKHGGQTGNKNGKGAHELNSLADDPPESRLAAPDLGEQKWELKGKENICNLTRRRGDVIEIRSVKFKKDMAKTPCQSARRSSYLEEPGSQCSNPLCIDFHNLTETTLTDVELIVQASFRQERVPLVSLMSRLNGKAIVGHLIDVEASDDSSSEILFARNHEIGCKLIGNGESSMLQPAWRTSRRTPVCYVPQPPPVPKDDGNPQAHQNPALLSAEARFKSLPRKQEFPRKPLKKPSLANQKRRTISTFDTKQRRNGNCDELQLVSQGCMMDDGLLKPKDSLPTRVTCVPVKQVFSKLLVAVGGLQS